MWMMHLHVNQKSDYDDDDGCQNISHKSDSSILLHGVISLPDTTSYDKQV